MVKKLLWGALAGGAILFLWGALSWMALPWHNMTMQKFPNETAVAEFLIHQTPQDGVYRLPWNFHKALGGPLVLASVAHQGGRPMVQASVFSFLIQALAAGFVTFLVLEGGIQKYWDRVGCVTVFAIAAGIVGYLPQWNWWGYSAGHVLVEMLDLVAGWFLAGLAIAKITAPAAPSSAG